MFACAFIAITLQASATDGTWSSMAGGSWASGGSWTGHTIATDTGATANFNTLSLSTDPIVTLDGGWTIGNLIFGDQGTANHKWTLDTGSGGPLTLAVTSGSPLISTKVATTIGAVLAGTQGLRKTGGGTLTLTGSNTYAGVTNVDNGTLLVNGSLANTAVTVSSGGILGGTGVIMGAANVYGTLAPGNSIGTLTISNNLVAIGTLVYELGASDLGASNDLVEVVGNLTLGGTLNIAATGGFGVGSYTLFTYTGALTYNGLAIGTIPHGFIGTIDTATAGRIRLVVAVAPPQQVSPASFTCGLLVTGQRADTTFQILNNSAGTLTGTATVASPFSITSGGSYSLAPGQTGVVTVAFHPVSAGTFTSNVVFTSNVGTNTSTMSGAAVNVLPPFEMIILGDTQLFSYHSPMNLLGAQTAWIKANLTNENIVFVSQVGDVTDTGGGGQWANQSAGFATLDGSGPLGVVPYSVNFGNHDGGAASFFGASRYANYGVASGGWYGGSSADSMNHYQIFTASGITLLHVNIRALPGAADLAWAQGIISANAGKPTMITTHAFLDGGQLGYNTWNDLGPSIWNLVSTNPQVFMIMCGHDWISRHEVATNSVGGKVLEIMTDYQDCNNGGDAWLQKIIFDPANHQIRSKTYSPTLDAFDTGYHAEWAYAATFATNAVTIGKRLGATSRFWNGASADKRWTVADNWGGTAPAAGDILVFRELSSVVNSTNDFPAGTSFAGLVLDPVLGYNTAQTLTFSGNALTLTGDIRDGNSQDVSGSTNFNLPIQLAANCAVNVNARTTTINGVLSGSGALTKVAGVGTLVLSATNTFTGGITVAGGILSIADGANLGSGPLRILGGQEQLTITGPAATISNDLVLGDISGTLNQASHNITLATPNNSATTISGTVSGGGPATIWVFQGGAAGQNTGALTLTGSNTLTGIIAVGGGPLILGNGSAAGLATIQLNSALPPCGALQFADSYNIANNIIIAKSPADYIGVGAGITGGINGVISGNGLTKVGAGTLALNGANTYTGMTTIGVGTLALNGSIAAGVTVSGGTLRGTGVISGAVVNNSGGTLAAGSATAIGALTINNTLTLNSGGTTLLRISKTGGVLSNDQVCGLAGVTYGGTLVVTNVTGDTTAFASGDIFYLFASSGSHVGAFSSLVVPPLPAGLTWNTSQLLANGSIGVSSNSDAPMFNPPAGAYVAAQTVSVSSATPGVTIYYTTDGSTPTTHSASGNSPVTINVPADANLTIKAFARVAGLADSPLATANYLISSPHSGS